MANTALFNTHRPAAPAANTRNEAGGAAYARSSRDTLAQYVVTGCLNATFYADAQSQLDDLVRAAWDVEPAFVAKAAVYGRTRGFMKDVPAVLCALLSVLDGDRMEQVFPRVVDDARMLRTFVQVLRSGAVGRRSLGSRPRRLVRQWLASRSDEALFRGSVGQSPSMADVVKMVHPHPDSEARAALYAYLLGRKHNATQLAPLVRAFEAFKAAGGKGEVPDVPFQLLTALNLDTHAWTAVARHASWQTTRMNLNTFARHGVFLDRATTQLVAQRLADPAQVKKARAFPYQLLMAWRAADGDVPNVVKNALQDAMEAATQNVPQLEGRVCVMPDVSGSMASPVTGQRTGSTTAVRCMDVAALVAACVLRRNPDAEVLPFAEEVKKVKLNPRDSVMTNADKLSALGGGGTNCSAPLSRLNRDHRHADLVFYVSDNQSWMDGRMVGQSTATMEAWNVFRKRNPQARMVCLDIQPYPTTQVVDRPDVMNVGGFGDAVFDAVAAFARGDGGSHAVERIEQVVL